MVFPKQLRLNILLGLGGLMTAVGIAKAQNPQPVVVQTPQRIVSM
ncbi:MAG: hypothetical protein U0Y10_17130 [Spirosomataceae bacterium]